MIEVYFQFPFVFFPQLGLNHFVGYHHHHHLVPIMMHQAASAHAAYGKVTSAIGGRLEAKPIIQGAFDGEETDSFFFFRCYACLVV